MPPALALRGTKFHPDIGAIGDVPATLRATFVARHEVSGSSGKGRLGVSSFTGIGLLCISSLTGRAVL